MGCPLGQGPTSTVRQPVNARTGARWPSRRDRFADARQYHGPAERIRPVRVPSACDMAVDSFRPTSGNRRRRRDRRSGLPHFRNTQRYPAIYTVLAQRHDGARWIASASAPSALQAWPDHLTAPTLPMVCRASVECAYAPPARISAATQIASMISAGVAPLRRASLVCPVMQ